MRFVLRFVRRLAMLPGISRLTRFGPLLRLSFALRASLVKERARFAWNEIRPGGRTETYRLRGSQIRIAIRHKTADVMVLDELFSQREYEFPEEIARILPPAPKIADLGANIGLFGAWVLARFPQAEVVGIEADPANAAVHRMTIAANDTASWRLVEGAAATEPGVVRLAAGQHATSHAAADDEISLAVEAIDAFPLLQGVDLIKIDIEGGEWALLADPRFAELDAAAVVLEYHADASPEADARGLVERRLENCGLDIVAIGPESSFATAVVWTKRKPD